MEAKLITAKEHAKIVWEDGDQFGEVTFIWDQELGKYIVDTEHLGVETLIKIMQSITIE